MPRPTLHQDTLAPAFIPGCPHTRYLVVHHGDEWLIKFDGEEYGPYRSEREAMLFAIDAAHSLGEQGEATQVERLDENGESRRIWTSGQDAYPPRL
jgi:hypothetical protein